MMKIKAFRHNLKTTKNGYRKCRQKRKEIFWFLAEYPIYWNNKLFNRHFGKNGLFGHAYVFNVDGCFEDQFIVD